MTRRAVTADFTADFLDGVVQLRVVGEWTGEAWENVLVYFYSDTHCRSPLSLTQRLYDAARAALSAKHYLPVDL